MRNSLRAFIQQLIAQVSGTHYGESGKWATHILLNAGSGPAQSFSPVRFAA